MTFDSAKAREICSRVKGYEDPDGGNFADFQAAMMLPVALDEIERLQQTLAAKDIELDNAVSDLKHEKERVEIMHLRRENEHRQINELGNQNNDLVTNCNQLLDRCWKAESELARWQKIAMDERCKAIMLIEKLKSVANDPSWENNGMKFNLGHYMEQAAQELRLEAAKEANYLERLEAAYVDMVFRATLSDDEAQAALANLREGKA